MRKSKEHYKGYGICQQSEGSFQIIVSFNVKKKYKTWRVPNGMSESKALRELEDVARQFRDEVKSAQPKREDISFDLYAKHFLKIKKDLKKVKSTTYSDYVYLLSKINPHIGSMNLRDITSRDLTTFFLKLSEEDAKMTVTVSGKKELKEAIKVAGFTIKNLAETIGIASNTISVAINTGRIRYDKALLVCNAINSDINRVFEVEQKSSAYASKTISSIVKITGSIFEMACNDGLIDENPIKKAEIPNYTKSTPNYLTDTQVVQILDESEKLDLKHRLMIELFIMTGARRGEIDGLTWEAIDFDNHIIHIRKEVTYTSQSGIEIVIPKTENGLRSIELPATTMILLEDYRDWYFKTLGLDKNMMTEDAYLFFQTKTLPDIVPMNPTSITKYFSEFSNKHGLPHLNPHALRHAYASVLIASGQLSDLELARALGHSSAQITREIYGHLLTDPASKTANIVSNVYNVRKMDKTE